MFDYLAAVDWQCVARQDLGVEESILVEVNLSSYNTCVVEISLLLKAEENEKGLLYTPIHPFLHDLFKNEEWAILFKDATFPGYRSYVSVAEAKQILNFCTRLSGLTVFW